MSTRLCEKSFSVAYCAWCDDPFSLAKETLHGLLLILKALVVSNIKSDLSHKFICLLQSVAFITFCIWFLWQGFGSRWRGYKGFWQEDTRDCSHVPDTVPAGSKLDLPLMLENLCHNIFKKWGKALCTSSWERGMRIYGNKVAEDSGWGSALGARTEISLSLSQHVFILFSHCPVDGIALIELLIGHLAVSQGQPIALF